MQKVFSPTKCLGKADMDKTELYWTWGMADIQPTQVDFHVFIQETVDTRNILSHELE